MATKKRKPVAEKRPARKTKKAGKLAPKRVAKKKASHLRQSKTDDFLKKLRQENSMVEYFTRLTILNPPAAKLMSSENQTRREGSFVRLAHAREEFTAPVITKGKSARKPTDDEK